jgi:hypothetical protein
VTILAGGSISQGGRVAVVLAAREKFKDFLDFSSLRVIADALAFWAPRSSKMAS